ncbi:MAG: Flp family type IVb pilin [Hoeflea sp.]|uniref:Flp family type IVb pilin n=1 Tax=Hoeflea sp. TaxID=1940281 RepID=UPI00272F35F9|nr:Flp family type IVb pilin [Hoeflea sp.]MDP2120811.1 Flp family type IVb pilin [Hoeflea sp.]MDP3526641.1 Flp family type IVb pilin [Hoeflea sp.]
MNKFRIFRFLGDRTGATALEYALIASLISIALIGGASTMGNAINTSMNDVSQHLKNTQ